MQKLITYFFLLSFCSVAFANGQTAMVLGLFYFVCLCVFAGLAAGVIVTTKKAITLKHLLIIYYLAGIGVALCTTFEIDSIVVFFLIQTILGLPVLAPTYLIGVYLTKKVIQITTEDIDFPTSRK
jgi:hypothetical protein